MSSQRGETLNAIGQDGLPPIAIVGMACKFPGGASNPSKLWDMIARKQSGRCEIPKTRMNVDAFYHPDPDRNGTFNIRAAHFLEEDISAFDAAFFSISPAEATGMDPQQRMMMESAYEAVENAGVPMEDLSGSNTGCYVGCFSRDYNEMLTHDPETSPVYVSTGNGAAILSNRVSYFFDLKGPSLTVDTACSSSLVALHLACQSLRSGESKAAIVGGTNLIFNPDVMIAMSNVHFLGADAKCHTYDASANGYSRGEGIAAIYIKPLEDAIRDNDTIRAVIRGTACNQDGRTAGIMLPSREAQESLIRSAYKNAKCDPATVGYFEAHGTGTPAGDPLEAGAIGSTLGQHRGLGDENRLYVGSVKTNIGHLEGASGLAGIIKTVVALEKGLIPPNLYFEKGNEAIDFEGWHIRVPTELTPWPTHGIRRASINSFGFGGTNAHVILDDAYHYLKARALRASHCTSILPHHPEHSPLSDLDTPGWSSGYVSAESDEFFDAGAGGNQYRIFAWSTHEEGIAKDSAAAYATELRNRKDVIESRFLADLSYTLCQRRSRMALKFFIVANSLDDLATKLENTRQKPIRSNARQAPRVAFVFTGQGAQWWGMGRELLQMYPVYKKSILSADDALKSFGCKWSLVEELSKDKNTSRINDPEISQPVCTAVQLSLVNLLADWDVLPHKVIGHSSGEIAAAYAAGKLTFNSALKVAFFRGLVSSHVQQDGAMLACGLSKEDAEERFALLDPSLGRIVVACVNSPSNVTLSGDVASIEQMEQILQDEKIFARTLKVKTAYHSHHMLEVADEYLQHLTDLKAPEDNTHFTGEMISTVTCTPVTGAELDAKYWVDNMLSPVLFSEGMQLLCSQKSNTKGRSKKLRTTDSVNILLEIGPHSALAGPIKQILASDDLQKSSIAYHSALVRDRDACLTTLEATASLWARGVSAKLEKANRPVQSGPRPQVLVDLPSYPWNHSKQFWAESRLSSNYRFRPTPRNDFIGAPVADWNPAEPRWRNFIRVSEQPWVKDHQVQGSIIYPAAGYISMALEAAKQMVPASDVGRVLGYTITEMLITRALVVPQTELGVEVIFQARPFNSSSKSSSDIWKEFRVFSYSSTGPNEHCRGLLSINYTQPSSEVDADRESREALSRYDHEFEYSKNFCKTSATPDKVYEDLSKAGLEYGTTFRNLVEISYGPGKALGKLAIPDTKSIMPCEYEYDHLVHPATLDTFLQILFPALTHAAANVKEPYMPTFIQEMHVSSDISSNPGHEFEVISEAAFVGFREATASIVVRDQQGETPKVRIQGVKCTALTSTNSADGGQNEEVKQLCFDVEWEPDLDLLSKPETEAVLTATGVEDTPSEYIATLEMVASYFYTQALEEVSEEQVVHPHHQKFFRYMQHHREQVLAGAIEHQTPEWLQFNSPAMKAKMEKLISKIEGTDYEGQLLCRMGRSLSRILKNEVDPLAMMLENELLYNYYANSLGIATSYAHLQKYISMLSHKDPSLKYLEIGAGTGGATVPILNALGGGNGTYPRFESYTYTDISSGFFEKAEQKFSDWHGLIDYRKLNIEQDLPAQGFKEDEKFDVIIAFNVLHATTNMNQTISNVRKLLKTGGKLLLLEITHVLNRVFLPFGNLPGWWMSEESFRQWGPTMTEDTWVSILKGNGFGELKSSTPDHQNPRDQTGRLMVAEAIDSNLQQNAPAEILPSIIIATLYGVGEDRVVADALQERLQSMKVPVTTKSYTQLTTEDLVNNACICVAEIGQPLLKDISPNDLEILKSILHQAKGLFWLTQGATQNSAHPEYALIHGLARTLRAEHEGFPLVTFDFDAKHPLSWEQRIDIFMPVIQRTFSEETLGDCEYSERDGLVYIKRCIAAPELNDRIAVVGQTATSTRELEPFNQPGRPLTLAIATPGLLDTLCFVDDPEALAPLSSDYVKIDVRATGLNFRDIMVCMGQLVDDFLGCECSGIVTEVGAEVSHLKVGDRVCTWTLGAYCSSLKNPAKLVQPIPDDMDFTVAASLPIVYCTAYYGLVDQARIQKGEKVLIHAAAGGVGQAAVMLCQLYGAEIFITVGTKEKKEHMMTTYGIPEDHIFSSRNLNFADGIKRFTKGKGVDIILNCLSGEALKASWSVIAPFGRFIEIGKKDIEDNTRLGMAPFIKNVAFSSVDLTVIFRQRKDLGARLLSEVMELLRHGSIGQVSPITLFPFSKIEEAFRYMQAGKHMGKIVLTPCEDDIVPVAARTGSKYRVVPDASYLIVGGFGGLGRSLSRRLVSQGAKNLIFVSRSGDGSPEAKSLVDELQSSGVTVEVLAVDITSGDRLKASLDETLKTMPPIRGIIQAAMVLEDRIFVNMTHETFTKVIRPKVQGSWNLHEATIDQPLDFFIMLASAAGMVGDTSQGNYAAANAFQDSLAHYRVSRGLPATVIDLGMVKSVGYVAENEGAAERNLARWGFLQIEEEEFLAMIDIAMESDKEQRRCQIVTGVGTQADFDRSQGDVPHWFRDPVFSHLHNMRARHIDTTAQSGPSLAQQLKETVSVSAAAAIVLDALMKKLSKSLMIALEDIDAASPTSVYGVDSLVAVEVRNWLLREVKADVPVFEILQASSLQLLGFKIAEKSSLVSENAVKGDE
ncbi:putative polyketide synthase [Annulohypoxylon maeteangense]|uniref:putative polyketide synthase n=1 Tax=Annulohypoxylon maeteangense TaxID=1927788 RepID=UPI002008C6F0|nr:putative polyketide synthase [Annulohypoxylon maeteangense]KAI0887631.1 putative polyketide synthase [Annulohypoxylon maeteangense]